MHKEIKNETASDLCPRERTKVLQGKSLISQEPNAYVVEEVRKIPRTNLQKHHQQKLQEYVKELRDNEIP